MLRPGLTCLNTSKTGIAFVVLSLGVACGVSSGNIDNAGTSDGGTSGGGTLADGGNVNAADGASNAADGSLLSADDGSVADAPNAVAPTIVSATPSNGAVDVALNGDVTASFSEPMDGTSLTNATFTVTSNGAIVSGAVIYSNSKVVFWPAAHLASGAHFTATVTTGAVSASGVALAALYSWSFTTGSTVAAGLPVDLGTAGNYAILSKAGISTVPGSSITGDIAVSPIGATAITGFSLSADPTNVFSTTPQVVGKVYAANYKPPTPGNLTTAVLDMQTAFTDAASRAPDVTELGAGNIGGLTLIPGVYKWGTGLLIPTNVTLAGSTTDVWIFQIAKDLTVSSATTVLLQGGAVPKNVFWQVAGKVDVGTTAHFEGIVLTHTQASLQTGASMNGRLLAQTAVTLASSTVTQPAP